MVAGAAPRAIFSRPADRLHLVDEPVGKSAAVFVLETSGRERRHGLVGGFEGLEAGGVEAGAGGGLEVWLDQVEECGHLDAELFAHVGEWQPYDHEVAHVFHQAFGQLSGRTGLDGDELGASLLSACPGLFFGRCVVSLLGLAGQQAQRDAECDEHPEIALGHLLLSASVQSASGNGGGTWASLISRVSWPTSSSDAPSARATRSMNSDSARSMTPSAASIFSRILITVARSSASRFHTPFTEASRSKFSGSKSHWWVSNSSSTSVSSTPRSSR